MSAMWRFTGHQNNIADIERLLREAERGRNPAGVHRMVRRAIFRSLVSEPFREFIRTTEKADGCYWPVATISAKRARELGLQERAGVLQLTSESVVRKDHQLRWSAWEGNEWEHVQRLIDEGRWVISEGRPNRREVWHDPDGSGKCWKVVFKETSNNELMMMTLHPIQMRNVRRLERRLQRKGSGD